LLARLTSLFAAAPPVFSGPAGERLYAVGDIHGRLDLLDDLLRRIVDDLESHPAEAATLAFLGDFIDRGPDSAGVVGRLEQLDRLRISTHFVMGNHEEMLLRVLAGEPAITYDWLRVGGEACAESYGLSLADLASADEMEIAEQLRQAIPAEHLAFLTGLDTAARFGDFLLVHAGIRPGVAIEAQRPADLRWIRRPFLADTRNHGVMVIHGHTVTQGVDRRVNRIGIDTGAYATGVLTAAVIEGADIRFLATGESNDRSAGVEST
jgi:serine/threonine protein phosphatase 1